jgi:hypothetical protein
MNVHRQIALANFVVLSLFLAFTIYAIVVDFRLSRRLMTFVDNTHKENGEPSDATESR